MCCHNTARPHDKRQSKENVLRGDCCPHAQAHNAHCAHRHCRPCLEEQNPDDPEVGGEPGLWRISASVDQGGLSSKHGDKCPPSDEDHPSGEIYLL